MTIALVNHAAVSGATPTGVDTTGADFLVFAGASYNLDPALKDGVFGADKDSKGNSYTYLTAAGTIDPRFRLAYSASGPTVGSSHTGTVDGTAGNYPTCAFAAFSGVKQTSPQGGQSATSGGTPGSLTPSEDNCLLFYGMAANGSGGSVDIGDSPKPLDSVNATNYAICTGFRIQTTAAAWNPTFTNTSGGAAMAWFKAAAGAAFIARSGIIIKQAIKRASIF